VNALRLLRHNQFLRHNAIFFVGSVAVGALNYLYYPVLGRLLTPASFGEVQTLVSLFLQIAIFLSVFGLVTINIVANYTDQQKRDAIIAEFEKLALIIALAFFAMVVLFNGAFKSFLQFDSAWPFIILALAIVVTVPFTFKGAFLRGRQAFAAASIANITGAGAKLVCSAGLVLAGRGTAGAIGGIVIAQVIAWAYASWKAKQLGLKKSLRAAKTKLPDLRLLAPELRYGLLVLIGSFIITVQYSIDIVIVKHYFDAHTAGLYAGVASVARIIFFLTASISMVLMPAVKLTNTMAENRRVLLKSSMLLCAIGLPALAIFCLFPDQVVGLLMGNAYADMTHLLPLLSLTIFIVSLLNLFVTYYLSLRRYGIAAVTLIGGGVTYLLMFVNHRTLEDVISGLLIGSIAMLAALIAWIVSVKIKEQLWLKTS
jgi:O-antigen/teichoic acid export membrane protein